MIPRKEILRHKVTCADCGKKGIVEIHKKSKKILTEDWWYYFKINVNACKTDKYMYRWIRDEKTGDFLKHKDGSYITEKIENTCYDPNIKKRYVEYWECPNCHKNPKEGEENS